MSTSSTTSSSTYSTSTTSSGTSSVSRRRSSSRGARRGARKSSRDGKRNDTKIKSKHDNNHSKGNNNDTNKKNEKNDNDNNAVNANLRSNSNLSVGEEYVYSESDFKGGEIGVAHMDALRQHLDDHRKHDDHRTNLSESHKKSGKIAGMHVTSKVIAGVARWKLHRRQGRGKHAPEAISQLRYKLGLFLEGESAQHLVLFLIALDVICVVVEILIDLEVIPHSNTAHDVEHVLHIMSLTILGIFIFEQLLLMFSFGRAYFTHIGYVVDFVVVTASFILELMISSDAVGLFIIVRLWRVVRVFHGIYVEVEHKLHQVHKSLDHEHKHSMSLENDLKHALEYARTLTALLKESGRIVPPAPRYEYVVALATKKERSKAEVDVVTMGANGPPNQRRNDLYTQSGVAKYAPIENNNRL